MVSLNKRTIFISTEHTFLNIIIDCKICIFDVFISLLFFLTSDLPLIRLTSAHVNLCFGHVGRDNIKESQSCDGSYHLARRLKIDTRSHNR